MHQYPVESAATSPQRLDAVSYGSRTLRGTLIALLLLFIAVVVAVPDRFFADDSYFYFQVAWNFARGMGSTFNNVTPTNGYHPLWMLCCSAIFAIFHFSRPTAIHAIGVMICLFDVGALVAVLALLRRLQVATWPLSLALLVPFCFVAQLGTEGALSGCMLALLLLTGYHLLYHPAPRYAILWNAIAGLAILSRLDSVFIVFAMWLGAVVCLSRVARRVVLVFLLAGIIPVALCGTYIWTNEHYFGLLEPISGYLKSHTAVHRLGGHLPHTALLGLALVLAGCVCMFVRQRDRFLLAVELPFALGVLVHSTYIVLFMSDETRWTWYYTSWILLASVLLARSVNSLIPTGTRRFAWTAWTGWATVAVLAFAWITKDGSILRTPDPEPLGEYQRALYVNAGLRRVLAFDGPGRMAYYSDLQVIPLDGLMSDKRFFQEIIAEGLDGYVTTHHVDGYAGYAIGTPPSLCGILHLDSTITHCVPGPDGREVPVSVEVYSRLPFRKVGDLPLRPEDLVWDKPEKFGVWRLH